MHPVDGRHLRGLDEQHQRPVTKWAREIAGRTTLHPWWNENTGAVHFCKHADEPTVAASAPNVRNRDGVVKFPDTDWVCRAIYQARRPARLKNREIAEAERRGKHDHREATEKLLADQRPELLDRARSRTRGRVSVLKD